MGLGTRLVLADDASSNIVIADPSAPSLHNTVLYVESSKKAIQGKGATGVMGQGLQIGVLGSSTGSKSKTGEEHFGVFGQAHNILCSAVGGLAQNGALAGHFKGGEFWIEHSLKVSGQLGIVPGLALNPEPIYVFYGLATPGPDSWFETFGEGRLHNGKASIKLDPNFVKFVDTGDYLVFLTPYGPSKGLYVESRAATEFKVLEQAGGTSHIAFSYRVTARRIV